MRRPRRRASGRESPPWECLGPSPVKTAGDDGPKTATDSPGKPAGQDAGKTSDRELNATPFQARGQDRCRHGDHLSASNRPMAATRAVAKTVTGTAAPLRKRSSALNGQVSPTSAVDPVDFGNGRPKAAVRRLQDDQTSVCSEISSASSTSMPRYRTVLSNLLWPSSN